MVLQCTGSIVENGPVAMTGGVYVIDDWTRLVPIIAVINHFRYVMHLGKRITVGSKVYFITRLH